MNKICIFLALMFLTSLSADAMLFKNYNAAGVKFRITFFIAGAKINNERYIDLPATSEQNVSFSSFQRLNNFNDFVVEVIVGPQVLTCGRSEGDSDNLIATFRNGSCTLSNKIIRPTT